MAAPDTSRPHRQIIPLLPTLALFALMVLLLPSPTRAGAAVTATLGANSRDHFKGAHFGYSGGIYMKWDEMVLIGVQSGIGSLVGPSSIPILGSALMRLPIGRVIMPFASGDVGYVLDDQDPGLLWRTGGGFDIKNGRYSSLLLQGGYEAASGMAGWYGRAGLLLEF
jgi:hypothetical protein